MIWTDSAIEHLKELWTDGFSATQCARQIAHKFDMPVTRNAVIGKVHRLKLEARKAPVKKAEKAMEKVTVTSPVLFKIAPPRPAQPSLVLPASKPVCLIDLPERSCKWALDEESEGVRGRWLFCGAPRMEGCPYCQAHWRRSASKAA